MTRKQAYEYLDEMIAEDDLDFHGQHFVDKIYDDFEEELKKSYIEGSNDAWKIRDESIEKAIISVEDDYGWIAYEDKQNCIEILYELRGH